MSGKQSSKPLPTPKSKPSAAKIAEIMRRDQDAALRDAVRGPKKKEMTPAELRAARAGGIV